MDEVGFEPTTSCNGTHDMVKSLRSKRATTVPSALHDIPRLQEIRKGRLVRTTTWLESVARPCEERSQLRVDA